MAILAKWASEHGQITKIGLSDGCGGKIAPEIVKIGYCRSGFDGYLGNVGLIAAVATIAIRGVALVLNDPRLVLNDPCLAFCRR